MKRLLAYLFIVLGLGLTFNVNTEAKEKYICLKISTGGNYWLIPSGWSTDYDCNYKVYKKQNKKIYSQLRQKFNQLPGGSSRIIRGKELFNITSSLDKFNTASTKIKKITKNTNQDVVLYDVIFCKIDNKVIPTFDSVSVYSSIKGTNNLKCPKYKKKKIKLEEIYNYQKAQICLDKNPEFKHLAFISTGSSSGCFNDQNEISYDGKDFFIKSSQTQIAKAEPSQKQKVVETVSLKLNKNEVDAIFSSVNSCWSIPLGLPYNQDLSVKIKVKFDLSGNVIRTEIIDFAKINKKGNGFLKVLAESALRAIKLCTPIKAPKDKYDLWKEVVFNFDAKDVLNGTESKDTKIAKNNLLNKAIETQITKAEPTIKPKKKNKIAKKELKQEEFKPKKTNQDNEAPVIEIAQNITVNDTSYVIEGKVSDKSDKIFIEIDGQPIEVRKGKFKVKRYSPVDEQVKIVAIDQWGNKSKPKIVNIKINIEETVVAENLEPLNPSNIRTKSSNEKIAIIIGIENYSEAPKANYANLDAQYFFDYARKAFGVKKQNINLLINENATVVKTDKALSLWLKSKVKKNRSDLIIFFAGHGLASSDGKELYLLPQDGNPDRLERTALSRTDLFKEIISLNPKSVTMFLDTCYSGVSRDEQMLLASARPIRIIADEQDTIPDNFTIFSASQLDQISSGLKKAKHGIFSYYLMRGLEGYADVNEDKKITNGELLAYMDENISQRAAEQGREQNPSLVGDPNKVLMSYR
jgi:hypothetical protein